MVVRLFLIESDRIQISYMPSPINPRVHLDGTQYVDTKSILLQIDRLPNICYGQKNHQNKPLYVAWEQGGGSVYGMSILWKDR